MLIGPQVLPASLEARTTIGRLMFMSGRQPSALPSANASKVPAQCFHRQARAMCCGTTNNRDKSAQKRRKRGVQLPVTETTEPKRKCHGCTDWCRFREAADKPPEGSANNWGILKHQYFRVSLAGLNPEMFSPFIKTSTGVAGVGIDASVNIKFRMKKVQATRNIKPKLMTGRSALAVSDVEV